MRRSIFAILYVLLSFPALAEGEKALQFDCKHFTNLGNGRWHSDGSATIDGHPFTNNEFGPGTISLKGVDVAAALTKQCGPSKR